MAPSPPPHPMARRALLLLSPPFTHPLTLSQTGKMGDPIFDAYYASNVQFADNTITQQKTMQAAGAALLDKIGPAVLIAHSQGGIFPWLWADVRPHLVKAIVSIEPTGPPFREAIFSNASARPWGLTDIPLTYSPPPTDLIKPLQTATIPSNTQDEVDCILQAEPARRLVNLVDIPVLVETAEASYHAPYDVCTVRFLKQAGVEMEYLRLVDVGVRGNGHLQFLERNSDEIAEVLEGWIEKAVERKG